MATRSAKYTQNGDPTMINPEILATINTIALHEAADGVTKSKVAWDYLGAQYEYDYALNSSDYSGEVPASAWKKKRDAALAKLKQAFGAQAIPVEQAVNAIVDKLYNHRAVRDTAADVKFRASVGMDEKTWVKLMSGEWDSYYPYEAADVKASKLSDTEARSLFLGSTELIKALKAVVQNPKKLDALDKADQMRLQSIAKMLYLLKLDK